MKKILHIAIACFYKEGWGYQENVLPAKHYELGFDTYIAFASDTESRVYRNENNVKVYALEPLKSFLRQIPVVACLVCKTRGLYDCINEVAPDIIFIHGLQAVDNLAVCKYKKKHPDVRVYVDQHGDYYNMPVQNLLQRFIHKVIFKFIAKRLESIAERFWGVTPWRVDYLQRVYGIAPDKTGLLVMGGDEKLVDWENRESIRNRVRQKYEIPQDAFLVVTGGRIDKAKNIHLLLDAFNDLNLDNAYLMIFGCYDEEMEKYCRPRITKNVRDVGWINSRFVYSLFLASDLGVFPGTHSVLWEQACASGLPCLFKDWGGGMSHVDVGGNCLLMKLVSRETLRTLLLELSGKPTRYCVMDTLAKNQGRKEFSYLEIAKRGINHS